MTSLFGPQVALLIVLIMLLFLMAAPFIEQRWGKRLQSMSEKVEADLIAEKERLKSVLLRDTSSDDTLTTDESDIMDEMNEEVAWLEEIRATWLYDPIDKDPAYKEIIEDAEREARAELERQGIVNGQFGYINQFSQTKKLILRKKHGIEWKTARELNPHVIID